MRKNALAVTVAAAVLTLAAVGVSTAVGGGSDASRRKEAQKLMQDGNYKEAYDVYRELALAANTEAREVGGDLGNAVSCLNTLNRQGEIDPLLADAVKVHEGNWRLLLAAAQTIYGQNHYGVIVGGKFERGYNRGGGRYVNCIERDRVQALQWLNRAMPLAVAATRDESGSSGELYNFYSQFAAVLLGYRGYADSWRLQYATDFGELPDYEDGYGYYYYGGSSAGAPVDEAGNPVFHKMPESFQAAASDGERWRFLLAMAGKAAPEYRVSLTRTFASFLYQQFGVQTLGWYGNMFGGSSEDPASERSAMWQLHTLKDNETIARLATGLKRFTLPDEFDFLRMYKETEDWSLVARIYEDRRQYDLAADYWKKAGEPDRVKQILGNWGQFESIVTQPAGKEATIEYRFRNGHRVDITAHAVEVDRLLRDAIKYIKSKPKELDWQKMNIQDVGSRLVYEPGGKRYIGQKVADWSVDLKPRALHFDSRTTITTPLTKPGVYLLTATMEDGNVTKVVIWIDDTVIAKKTLDKATWFYVADAVTGAPLPGAELEFFGYRQEYVENYKNDKYDYYYKIYTKQFTRAADEDGQVVLDPKDYPSDYTWVVVTHTGGRLAYLGFTGIWYGSWYDYEYNQVKTFSITDRPVYRPNQSVKFKFWVREARYDVEDRTDYADREFRVFAYNPRGEKVWEKTLRSDKYAGFHDEMMLPSDAPLGVWSLYVDGYGGTSFRVEEYKKPEFEVTVEAPSEPVMLGEKIEAKVRAKYYFGAPVTNAKVKFKVLRSDHSARWFPVAWWDWFYGPGYWWFAYDYAWYPGWRYWGTPRPIWWWWPVNEQPPELVAEAEVRISEEGEVRIPIDTALAKELHGDRDHRYEITAEVTDASRRVIVGTGQVLVARNPFKVYAWVDRGHYRVGDVVEASFSAQTLDNKGVKGKGKLSLMKLTYKDGKPVEAPVQKWDLDTDDDGRASLQAKASQPGQYRFSYSVTDAAGHSIEGGYVFMVMGQGEDGHAFRFNEIELVPDKKEYAPGESVNLMVNTDRAGSTVLLFQRPSNGVYLKPKVLRLSGKSVVEAVEVVKKDMPNFFVEALTVSDGKVFSDTREIIVPPEKRVFNVDVIPSSDTYKPGETARVRVRLTDTAGKPIQGSAVLAVYDKSVEYISGGSNVPEIKSFFWKWRRSHYGATEHSLSRAFWALVPEGEPAMGSLGAFGHMVADDESAGAFADVMTAADGGGGGAGGGGRRNGHGRAPMKAMAMPAPASRAASMDGDDAPMAGARMEEKKAEAGPADRSQVAGGQAANLAQPTVRKEFADTAFWAAALTTDKDGFADVEFKMPENLTGWKVHAWAMGDGTRVGEGTAQVVTVKNLLLRLQAPRFFVQKDEVVLSANIHNYLDKEKEVTAVLELDGPVLTPTDARTRKVTIKPRGEARVDWRVKVASEGEAVVRMKALTDEESDAMEMRFPAYVHGMLKTESFSGVVRPAGTSSSLTFTVPAERRVEQSRIEVRYSPTLAAAMVDALPYLADYPYGCTEQTLNRFLPTVITQSALKRMGQDLEAIRKKLTNLNAQEIGDDRQRAEQWKRYDRSPVFDQKTVDDMVKTGVARLVGMQLSDGGWGWFSGWGEQSWPHTTATVVHGFQIAVANGVKVPGGVIDRGLDWLENYQQEQIRWLKNAKKKKEPWKDSADNLDAFIYMVLADGGRTDKDMRDFLYRDRTNLAVYGKALFGMGLFRLGEKEKLAMVVRNIDQFLVEDKENQTAYLNLGAEGYWWYWYGSEYEAQAYYLKLLSATDPGADKTAGLVKYLLNNRKHATYWNSTRDTALVVEAFADYLQATGEDKPDMTIEILLDGQRAKEVEVDASNLFTFDNKLVLEGKAVTTGKHVIEVRRKGKGPVYFNAYVTNFTLEDYITKAGLEIKVERKYYQLVRVDKTTKVSGSRGQALDQKVEKYERKPIADLQVLKSGDLVEIEMEIESKNDYEYILLEDMKPAGFEPVEVRSGYNGNDMGAYVEFRDERVAFFIRWLARGKHSVAYRMRAEIPGKFSALPTRAGAMYAPELRANSDEIKIGIED